ncbi:hypothetical protein B0H66DRAFT_246308 [Apodospora peruviana]|uniref:Uncharacterized protein n=1 Tax=Apodospora peruviana TaxID=516989 RepID=A0AAE0M5J0_9PEZI|nr:hypothetical protein B0H66DRAFT_246308 [Apodospora peruviana]
MTYFGDISTSSASSSAGAGAGADWEPQQLSPGDPLTAANIARLSIVRQSIETSIELHGGALFQVTKGKPPSSSTTDSEDGGGDYVGISDWDEYGSVPEELLEYKKKVAALEGSSGWNADQRKLHKLIFMRGLHPMIPSWWRMSFRMWGITQEELDDVFTPPGSKKRVVIHAYSNEVAAAKALESLFYLSQTVTDYEQIGYEDKIAPMVIKEILKYYRWALRDVGLDKFKVKPTMLIREYRPELRWLKEERDEDDVDEDDIDEDALTDAERRARFTEAVSRDLERRLLSMALTWRDVLWDDKTGEYVMQPPTLYAFAVVQHMVMLVSHDSAEVDNPVVVLDQVRLNERGAWLWNALSIAIPINMIRDGINHNRHPRVIVPRAVDPSDEDPDL